MKIIILSIMRRLLNNKTHLGINLLGLGTGMIAFLFITSWITGELSYDRFWDKADQVYRVALSKTSGGNEILNTAKNYDGVGPVLLNELPDIETTTHLNKDMITVFTPEVSIQNVDMFFTDSSFFHVFPIPVECENKQLLFSDIHSAIMSRSLAKKIFGNKNPINQTFKLNEGWEFYVIALFDDIPENSHIKCDLLLQRKALTYYIKNFDPITGTLDNQNISSITDRDPYGKSEWKNIRSYTYIRLKPESNINRIEANYKKIIAPCIRHIQEKGEKVNLDFQPIIKIHLHSNKDAEMFTNGSSIKVMAFALIGLLLLITSIFNYINLSVANTISKLSNYKIHYILGANNRSLFMEFFLESLIINTLAGIICFLTGVFFLKDGITIGGFVIFPVALKTLVLVCISMVLVISLLTSVYPYIFTVSRNRKNLQNVNKRSNRGTYSSITALVVFQFSLSIFLIIGTISIFRQIQFMQNTNIGMNIDQTMVSFSPMTMIKKPDINEKLQTYKNEVLKIPGVKAFTTAEIVAGKDYERFSNDVRLKDGEENKTQFALANVDQNYFDFFSIGLSEGVLFSTSTKYGGDEIIINQTACKQLGISQLDAVTRSLTIDSKSYRIIGVINDYHHLSLKDEIMPVVYFNSLKWSRDVGYYFVKISPTNRQKTIRDVKKLWDTLYPLEEYHYSFLDEQFNEVYKSENNFGKIYLELSLLTIFIACMGLFALANFSTKARMKEIGIHKINGATVLEVVNMLNLDFLKWVLIGFVISCPIAYYVMNKWLHNFAYRTQLSWWIFALAGLLALVIALLTVSWQSWKAATRNPVESLKYE